MPYVAQKDRVLYDCAIDDLITKISQNCENPESAAGVLNYCMTRLVLGVFKRITTKFKYWHVALICGILDNVKSEFYRRKASDYEDEKIKENGDLDLYAGK